MFKSLRWSIFLLGAIGALAAVVMAAQGYWLQGRMGQNATEVFVAKDVVADILPPPMYLIELRLVLSQAVEGTLTKDEAKQNLERLASEYQERVDYWNENPPYGLEQYLLGHQHEAGQKFIAAAQAQIIDKLLAGETEAARNNLAQVHALYLEHRAGVNETVVEGNKFGAASMTAFDASHAWSNNLMFGLAFLVVTGVLVFCRLVQRGISGLIGAEPVVAARSAQAIADGDLSEEITIQAGDKTSLLAHLKIMQASLIKAADLAHAVSRGNLSNAIELASGDSSSLLANLQRMQTSLSKVVNDVRRNADKVAGTSEEISRGNDELASRTENQTTALVESAAAIEQLGATMKHSADNAKRANQLALGASTVALKGGEVVGHVVDTMKGINDSSKKIADIIGVIDAIAFQTNILALNAAVEAARAGEQGRGFAVVASEVRSLAGRSANAAKEIKTLIGASVTRVEQGTALVDQAGVTMAEIVSSIRRVTDIIGEISSAAAEQNIGMGQISEAVAQIDQSTQQNAVQVQRSATVAADLQHQAQHLVQAVAVFQLHEDAQSQAGLASAQAAPSERRGPSRATNVTRASFDAQASPATKNTALSKTGTDAGWDRF